LLGVLGDRGEYKNIAIFLMKNWTCITNKQSGELFGGLSSLICRKCIRDFQENQKVMTTGIADGLIIAL
jgi:hypothetical protein